MSKRKAKQVTIQVRVTPECKRVVELLQDEVYAKRGIRLTAADALLEIMSKARPDLVKQAVKEVSGESA